MWIVDVQGYDYEHSMKFMCKEIALINCDNGFWVHKIIKLPFDVSLFSFKMRNNVQWLSDYIHGLDWNMSSTDCNSLNYEDLAVFLKSYITENDDVAVKGSNKKVWLSKMISNEIIELTDEGCLPFDELKMIFKTNHCNRHLNNNLNCSLENVNLLYKWCLYCKK